jgi:hypothetical protein
MLWRADAEHASGSGLVWHLRDPPNRCRLSLVVQQDAPSHRRLLTLLLVITIVFVPLNGYMLTRRWGVFLIVCYLITMCATVVVELKGQSS